MTPPFWSFFGMPLPHFDAFGGKFCFASYSEYFPFIPHIFTNLFLRSSKFNVKKGLYYQRRVENRQKSDKFDVDLHQNILFQENHENYCARKLMCAKLIFLK